MTTDTHDNLTLGRLLYEIAKIWRSRIDISLQAFGLSRAKWDVILMLESQNSQGISQRDLARLCAVEPPTMASMLDRMEKEGWVERRVCDGDRRSKRTVLTDKAKAIRTEIREVSFEVEQEVFAILPPQTYDDIKLGLLQLREALEKTRPATDNNSDNNNSNEVA